MAERASNMQRDVLVLNLEGMMAHITEELYGRSLKDCDDAQTYTVVLRTVKDLLAATERNFGEQIVYVVSASFNTEPMLEYNLRNMQVYDRIDALLKKNGKDLAGLMKLERSTVYNDSGASAFTRALMDMMAAQGMEGEGLALFRPDALVDTQICPGVTEEGWEEPARIDLSMRIAGKDIHFVPMNIKIAGYMNGRTKIRLFDSKTVESPQQLAAFMGLKEDDPELGGYFTAYREYMLASGASQIILYEMKRRLYDLRRLCDHAQIQVHDAYPALVIPELIRILVEEKAFTVDEAIEVARASCIYTYYPESKSGEVKLPLKYLNVICPDVASIVRYLDRRVRETDSDEEDWIINGQGEIRMDALGRHCGTRICSAAAMTGVQ